MTKLSASDEAELERMGFEPRYYLCKHPAWPDPLNIWPPTQENAEYAYRRYPHPDAYVLKKWAEGPRDILFPPRGEDSRWKLVEEHHETHEQHVLLEGISYDTAQKYTYQNTGTVGWSYRILEDGND